MSMLSSDDRATAAFLTREALRDQLAIIQVDTAILVARSQQATVTRAGGNTDPSTVIRDARGRFLGRVATGMALEKAIASAHAPAARHAFISTHGQTKFNTQMKNLHTAANSVARGHDAAHVTAMKAEIQHLAQKIAASNDPAARAKMRSEAIMLQRQVNRAEAKTRVGTKRSGMSVKDQKEVNALHKQSAKLQYDGQLPTEMKPDELPKMDKATTVSELSATKLQVYGGHVAIAQAISQAYGEQQLGARINGYSEMRLRSWANELGISPEGSHTALVSRITAHLTEGRYSANFGSKSEGVKTAKAGSRTKSSTTPQVKSMGLTNLKPVAKIDIAKVFNPHALPNTHLLHQVYGTLQLKRAISSFSFPMTRRMAHETQAAHPGTKPQSWTNKQHLVDYIYDQEVGSSGHIGPATQEELEALGNSQNNA